MRLFEFRVGLLGVVFSCEFFSIGIDRAIVMAGAVFMALHIRERVRSRWDCAK